MGSLLIGQPFADPGISGAVRPPPPHPYNASLSSGSNLGPLNLALSDAVAGGQALRDADRQTRAVPVDLVTASASGLDPHISPAAAEYQVVRVARVRNLDPQKVRALVAQFTEDRQLASLASPGSTSWRSTSHSIRTGSDSAGCAGRYIPHHGPRRSGMTSVAES